MSCCHGLIQKLVKKTLKPTNEKCFPWQFCNKKCWAIYHGFKYNNHTMSDTSQPTEKHDSGSRHIDGHSQLSGEITCNFTENAQRENSIRPKLMKYLFEELL